MLTCPKCKHNKLNTINSRPNKIPDAVWRQRKCLKCEHVFQTVERILNKKTLKHTLIEAKPPQRPLKRQQRPKKKANVIAMDLENLTDSELEELMFSSPEIFNDDEM